MVYIYLHLADFYVVFMYVNIPVPCILWDSNLPYFSMKNLPFLRSKPKENAPKIPRVWNAQLVAHMKGSWIFLLKTIGGKSFC